MNNCPCCSGLLLRHIRGTEVYYFCRNCWQTMPSLELKTFTYDAEFITGEFSRKPLRGERSNTAVVLNK